MFKISDSKKLKNQMLNWCSMKDVFAFIDSNGYNKKQTGAASYPDYDFLAAINALDILCCNYGHALNELGNFISHESDWYFGMMGYDLKNEIESLESKNRDQTGFPDLCFFRPELIFLLKSDILEIHYHEGKFNKNEIHKVYCQIMQMPASSNKTHKQLYLNSRMTKKDYLAKVNAIKKHIFRGDIYEVNFCQEFYAENVDIAPHVFYQKLADFSPAPYASLYRFHNKYLISSSPERYLLKKGRRVISQPMKGTIKRSRDEILDRKLKYKLRLDPKEVAENIMIVDLVRNDLAKTALRNSVAVEELCGIYSYSTVHQMVSTIRSDLNPEFNFIDIIKNTFPMGSMTGAPKFKAMQLIERYEDTKRGIYSGAAGYITPENDFDFSVIIRSILYNQTNGYLSFMTGSAITADSCPEFEYKECYLKAKAVFEALK